MSSYTKKFFYVLNCLFALSLISFSFPAIATTFSYKEGVSKANALHLSMPAAEKDGRIQTVNRKGAMSPRIDYVTSQFLKNLAGKTVLEIGAAYGNVLLQALQYAPDVVYHVNDMDERHVLIAARRVHDAIVAGKISAIAADNVSFLVGDFPEHIDLKNNFYDAVLIARVLHFFDPEKLKASIRKIFDVLKDEGRVYIIAVTPYIKRFESFIPEYEKRLSDGDAYPGYVSSLLPYINPDVTSEQVKGNMHQDSFMFLDDVVLRRLLIEAGFKVLESGMIPLDYCSEAYELDGRENVILIAEKSKKQQSLSTDNE
ncbi:Methyltransf_12 domain-containing protein [Alphaproteobacteria bacterium]